MAMEKKEQYHHQIRLNVVVDPPVPPSDPRIPFFGRRHGSRNTWAVSAFIVLDLVLFVVTMLVNDCPGSSPSGGAECLLRPLGRLSFQPLHENPLLGPSSSTLLKMGALQRNSTMQLNKKWHILSFPWLHGGVIHLLINLSSTILIGVHLEQEFGPLRAAIIYLLSALMGGVTSAIFVQHAPAVGSSAPLFGLLGATLAGMIRNWEKYAAKISALVLLGSVAVVNFIVGLLPHVDNFSNIGGFLSGTLVSFVLLFDPRLSVLERKKGIFDYDLNASVKLKQKLDRPALRIVALLSFSMILAGGLAAVFLGVNMNEHCVCCRYIDCVPTKMWSCNVKASSCEATVSDGRLTLTCTVGDKFRTFPHANVSQGRMDDLCSLICS